MYTYVYNIYIHKYIHIAYIEYVYEYTYVCNNKRHICIYIYTYIYIYIYIYIMHTHVCIYIHICIHTHTHIYIYTYTKYTCIHAYSHAYIRMNTHKHKHAHTHTPEQAVVRQQTVTVAANQRQIWPGQLDLNQLLRQICDTLCLFYLFFFILTISAQSEPISSWQTNVFICLFCTPVNHVQNIHTLAAPFAVLSLTASACNIYLDQRFQCQLETNMITCVKNSKLLLNSHDKLTKT
jgi:hypothetical protein